MDGDTLPECWASSDNIVTHTQIYGDREEGSVPRSDVNSSKGRIRVRVSQKASTDSIVYLKKLGE